MRPPRFPSWLMRLANDGRVSLEVRLYRLICVVQSAILLLLVLPFNIVEGLPWPLNLMVGVLGLALLLFLWASFHGRHFIRATHFLGTSFLNVAWFLNAGIQGSMPYFFFVVAVFALVLFRGWTRILAIFLLGVNFGGLLLVGHFAPGAVLPFSSAASQLLDLFCGFIAALAIVVGMLAVVVADYERKLAGRQLAEERLHASLAEKEVLINELYHRTKNNMQVISSLMHMQQEHVRDTRLLRAFQDVDQRIQSMALVQRHLFESRDLSNISLREYLGELGGQLLERHGIRDGRIRLDLEAVEDLSILLDTAIPFGLVCNEVLANCLRHGYPDGRSGRIAMGLRQLDGQTIQACISDDGVGVPPGRDFRAAAGMGLTMAFIIAETQLMGSLSFSVPGGSGGVTCELVFRSGIYRRRV